MRMSKVYSIPDNMRVYAIGDIHGYADVLDDMHRRIAVDIESNPVDKAQIVYLGDYVDRGPDSRGVIERLVERELYAPTIEHIYLLGNHEDAMLSFLTNAPEAMSEHADWLMYGGLETLESYDIRPDMSLTKPDMIADIGRDLKTKMPKPHQEFLKNLKLYYEVGGYLFVHAGIKPGVKLERQDKHDFTFRREPFMSYEKPHPWRVVHGHTPSKDKQVDIRPNRINIDTGLYMGGALSCIALQGEDVRLIEVSN